MQVTTTTLAGVLILEPRVFGDARGFFMESYNRRSFAQAWPTCWNGDRSGISLC